MIVKDINQNIDRRDFQISKKRYEMEYAHIEEARENGCKCQICGDTKYIPCLCYNDKMDYYYFALADCKCRNTDSINKKIAESGLKRELERKTFKSFVADNYFRKVLRDKAVEFLQAVKGGSCCWFYVGGQSGSGKTHICTAISGRFLNNNQIVVYMRWVDEMRRLKADLGNTSRIDEFKKAQVLYIDDLFKGGKYPTDYEIGVVFEILNYRDTNELVTIISSELTDCRLRMIDEAVYGRIKMNTGDRFMISIGKDEGKNYRLRTDVNR